MLSVVPISKKAARKGKSLVRQVKALIASKKKDAADVLRATVGTAANATTASCYTSSTDFATAASGTGLLDMDGDECLINSVRIRNRLEVDSVSTADPAGDSDILVRKLLVWYAKPLLVASAAGTLPPVTEVLVSDSIFSLKVTPAANGGRFQVLSDKTISLGMNIHSLTATQAYAVATGPNTKILDYTVKVNKMCKYAANGVSGTPSGHYDSDVANGRIDRGLLVMYTLYHARQAFTDNSYTRLNYTG